MCVNARNTSDIYVHYIGIDNYRVAYMIYTMLPVRKIPIEVLNLDLDIFNHLFLSPY